MYETNFNFLLNVDFAYFDKHIRAGVLLVSIGLHISCSGTIILMSCLLWLYPRTGWEYISTGTGKTDQSVQLTRKYQIMALPSLYQVIPVTVQGFIKPGIIKNQGLTILIYYIFFLPDKLIIYFLP